MIQQPQQGQQFQGFKPSGVEKIANAMGFQGNIKDFQQFLQDNPDRQAEMMRYQDVAKKMVSGGLVKMQKGGSAQRESRIQDGLKQRSDPTSGGFPATPTKKTIAQVAAKRVVDPKLPTGAAITPYGVPTEAGQAVDPTGSQVGKSPTGTATQAGTTKATAFNPNPEYDFRYQPIFPFGDPRQGQPLRSWHGITEEAKARTMDADKASDKVTATTQAINAAQLDPTDSRSKVTAAEATKSSVSDLTSAQGTAIKLENPVQRKIEAGELIEGVADAEKASKFTEQVQAAETTPSKEATVQGQLETLTADFDSTNPPPWAAGALRAVQTEMAKRGLGASSMSAQAMVQASLESALPIAMADAKTIASFESQNLSNRQQRAMLAAQQRASFMGIEFDQAFQSRVMNSAKIADIANMNFNADQQIALENSRMANTMNLNNLSNRQALVMAEAGALANIDMANLSNRQQSAVMNAQSFLQRDMANLSNKQQTELFKGQQRIQSLFNDQSAENAARQFNATSQNQVDQFFAQLRTQTSQFNAAQENAHRQFNAGETNAMEKFNNEMQNQRDQFNAKNRLLIDQSNAQWRREIATADTTAINRANELNATAVLNMSNSAYNNLWQQYSDIMEMSWESTENERQRVVQMAVAQLQSDTSKELTEMKADYDSAVGFGNLIGTFLTAGTETILGSWFKGSF